MQYWLLDVSSTMTTKTHLIWYTDRAHHNHSFFYCWHCAIILVCWSDDNTIVFHWDLCILLVTISTIITTTTTDPMHCPHTHTHTHYTCANNSHYGTGRYRKNWLSAQIKFAHPALCRVCVQWRARFREIRRIRWLTKSSEVWWWCVVCLVRADGTMICTLHTLHTFVMLMEWQLFYIIVLEFVQLEYAKCIFFLFKFVLVFFLCCSYYYYNECLFLLITILISWIWNA